MISTPVSGLPDGANAGPASLVAIRSLAGRCRQWRPGGARTGPGWHHIGRVSGEHLLDEAMPSASDQAGALAARNIAVKRSDMLVPTIRPFMDCYAPAVPAGDVLKRSACAYGT
jgi:hypothetical protein